MPTWIEACGTGDIDDEDLIRWDHGGRTYAIYNTEKGFFATDGHCTHEEQHLEDGLVIGMVIECPLHGGRFDIATGRALSAPVCVNLATYPVEVRGDRLFVGL
jgi:3-phenylpropionate/trans-cinnamate dioxygenase ferredoxin subunit